MVKFLLSLAKKKKKTMRIARDSSWPAF